MRIFEILTLGTLFLALTARFWPVEKRSLWTNCLPGMAVLFILSHLVIERYRWQMVPAYTLAGLLVVLGVPKLWRKKRATPIGRGRKIINVIGTGLGFVAIVIAAALPALFPVFQMPDPTGPYAVGTTSFAFADDSRPEIFTPDPDDKRVVYVQAWYPAQSTVDSTPAPLWIKPENLFPVLVNSFLPTFMPDYLFDHLALVESQSYFNAPLALQEAAYPVLVFSHGYAEGFFAQNMVQMEELASHGYIIFSVGHAYESSMVFDAQGHAISMSETQMKAFNKEDRETNELFQKSFYATGAEQIEAVRAWLAASPVALQSIQIWTQDMQFVLSQVEFMNRGQVDSPFAGHLDTARIGVFGQSFGGAIAFQVCAIDSRCKASINMDGTQWGTLVDDPLQTPFLMMYNETNDRANDWALNISPAHGYSIRINGTTHINFTDFNLISSLFKHPQVGILGNIDPQQIERIMNAYTLAFFDQTLKGIPSPLLQARSPDYPEVELKIYK
jgi:predicted dienelactone hydrolase